MRRAFAALIFALLAAAGPVEAAPHNLGPLELRVDLSERELIVVHDGRVEHTIAIAIGQDGHPTPTGHFTIDRIIWNPAWVPPSSEWAKDAERKEPGEPDNPMQGAKLFFKHPSYYIHGTNQPGSLGEAASHGCIRMAEDDVQRLARIVQEHGGAARSAEWYSTVVASEKDKREIVLPDEVPLSIEQ